MFRAGFLAIALVATSLAVPLPTTSAAAVAQGAGQNCQRRNEGRRRGLGIAAGIAGGLMGRMGGGAVANLLPMASVLGDALMNLLDCQEQEKAAEATEQVIEQAGDRGQAAVGTTQAWRSETRPGVSGSSTITAVEANAVDGDCMTVTDIVIIDGEETRAPKRMCRRPPSNRFVRV